MNLKKIKDNRDIIYELNALYAEELVAFFQYFNVAPFLSGEARPDVQKFYTDTANDELNDHAVKLLNRINELAGVPLVTTFDSVSNFSRVRLAPINNLYDQLCLNFIAEAEAIAHYQKVIQLSLEISDYVTADILKEILADEEQHITEIRKFIEDMGQPIPTID